MKNILIVDDNENNLLTLELLLEDFKDIKITKATNGKDAISACLDNKFDIILMDIMMPIMNGVQATKEIRRFEKNSMIIAVSALDDDDYRKQMVQAGAEDYITKPIDNRLFNKRLDSYLRLIDMRKLKSYANTPVNLFGIPVYSRSSHFNIREEQHLAEFWEFYLVGKINITDLLSDCVRTLYDIGLVLLKTNIEFKIVAEEDDRNYYFTIVGIRIKDKNTLSAIIAKECRDAKYMIDLAELTIISPKYAVIVPAVVEPVSVEVKSEISKILEIKEEQVESSIRKLSRKISAQEFTNEVAVFYQDKIESLEVLEDRFDSLVYEYETKKDVDTIRKFAEAVGEYANTIASLLEFGEIVTAMHMLSALLGDIDESQLSGNSLDTIPILLLSILQDLTQWRIAVFIDKTTVDIHYLDDSLMNSCKQVQMLLNTTQVTSDRDDDLEFF